MESQIGEPSNKRGAVGRTSVWTWELAEIFPAYFSWEDLSADWGYPPFLNLCLGRFKRPPPREPRSHSTSLCVETSPSLFLSHCLFHSFFPFLCYIGSLYLPPYPLISVSNFPATPCLDHKNAIPRTLTHI